VLGPTCESSDCFFLCSHECVVGDLVEDFASRDELDVCFLCAADMGDRFFSELNARFPIRLNNISSHIWVALSSLDDKAIVATRRDVVLPDLGCAELGPVRARNLYAVLVGTLNLILDYVRLVVVHFDTDFIQVELVSYDLITQTRERGD